jgi:uroporphyrinogen III methyltransferase/synthase
MNPPASCDRLPLSGRSVLVTRPRQQSQGLVRRLEELGATVYVMPLLEIGPPPDPAAVDRVIARLDEFDWLIFTSANGVEGFLSRLELSGQGLQSLAHLRVAAIGPKTAESLRQRNLHAEMIPTIHRSEEFSDALLPLVAGQRVLLARADRGRELLQSQLATVARVEHVAVYSQAEAGEVDGQILESLRRGEIEFVTLTSANIVRAFARLLDSKTRQRLGRETRIVTLSPVTSAAARELGLPVAREATDFTSDGLIEAIQQCVTPP